ncbi:hypothetical protein HYX16_00580 [Candidatus Woesearchaeota archaeon]|nr:hypothetical protein [Candidatus Woesearchaeota archaeon]
MYKEREIVLDFIRMNGPVLPIQVAKQINGNTMLAGAILSELFANNLIKISNAKIGGSHVYYAVGQEEKLSILYEHLPGKEKEAYTLLKNNKFLFDELQEPAIRVALRQIKDFSKEFIVKINDEEIKGWRWYLTKEDEANNLARELLKEEIKNEPIIKPEVNIKTQKAILEKPVKEKQNKLIGKKIKEDTSKFFEDVKKYLEKNKVKVLDYNIITKGKDIEFISKIDSSFGELNYLIKAKNKKTISEKDVVYSHNDGNLRKMPVILLSNGKLSKKAEKYINEKLHSYLLFRKIE